ncbi:MULTISPECIES: TetR/AcrR family transcriptional regulator [Bacillus cereus group]|uniref:Transcriptional regulator, TetR family n=1 Tax=Bacillus cytotoxicus (strain DSM 22905 / CIP 110041 / 391-98 / NVH 391-98) TaxID=315749 RepID=A7GUQ5_BACCN|nr:MULTISPECIES: TetR/AcrR family transcriptional regulator [Bacillus cereus group]ABS23863.1 transcriptional regulator, TetR family [Bacillus cytotoxicus NVH 391-98]AWC46466.1 TetR/AcrR family transcriptional regulator [Bacillus cytotoxicus]MDH2865190.1 TetR/AcrR family transcriptional regulator [Bacillus cytotoxicus]MDH2884983.1 TetR/AcrR family transcriptional regulator [Bacillus cytotoxicus]MDH2888565.1 TetR/AcrR family transcriptional regulator [Bacillus cytotoxicus]
MCKKNLTKRKQQALLTQSNISQVFLNLTKEKKFENITIEDICKRANVSVGTFYHYFSSKEDIYKKIFQQIDENLHVELENIDQHTTVQTTILNFFQCIAEYTTKLELHINLLNDLNKRSFIYEPSLIYKTLKGFVYKGQLEKELTNDMSVEEITTYLFTFARGLILDWCILEGAYSLEQRMDTYMKLALKSLKP